MGKQSKLQARSCKYLLTAELSCRISVMESPSVLSFKVRVKEMMKPTTFELVTIACGEEANTAKWRLERTIVSGFNSGLIM